MTLRMERRPPEVALYVMAVILAQLRRGSTLSEAYYTALLFTGKVEMLTGFTLAAGVVTWALSPIKFQADIGILLAFMFIWNMVSALVLIPALAYFIPSPRTRKRPARLPPCPTRPPCNAPRGVTQTKTEASKADSTGCRNTLIMEVFHGTAGRMEASASQHVGVETRRLGARCLVPRSQICVCNRQHRTFRSITPCAKARLLQVRTPP